MGTVKGCTFERTTSVFFIFNRIYNMGKNLKKLLALAGSLLFWVFVLLWVCIPSKIYGADEGSALFFITPTSRSYVVGDVFTVTLNVSTDFPINAVEADLVYPADKLELVSFSKEDSIIDFWVNGPVVSRNSGDIYFAGVIPNPGYKGNGGSVLGLNFRVKSSGDAIISVSSGSVLANDSFGTQILSKVVGGRYRLELDVKIPEPTSKNADLETISKTMASPTFIFIDKPKLLVSEAPDIESTAVLYLMLSVIFISTIIIPVIALAVSCYKYQKNKKG